MPSGRNIAYMNINKMQFQKQLNLKCPIVLVLLKFPIMSKLLNILGGSFSVKQKVIKLVMNYCNKNWSRMSNFLMHRINMEDKAGFTKLNLTTMKADQKINII